MGMDRFEEVFERLERSAFRRRFRLGTGERAYVRAKGMGTIREHAVAFVGDRLAPAVPRNDGKQTPMRGHPVFIAQHACGCCCRGCLRKWHGIAEGRELGADEKGYVVDLLMAWIGRQMDGREEEVLPRPKPTTRRTRTRKSPGGETPGLPFLS